MRYFVLIITMIILALSTACTSAQDDITSPATPELLNSENYLDTHVAECRANMRAIAGQAVIFFANNANRYPEDLEEMGMAGYMCPACSSTYIYAAYFNEETQEPEYFLSCPQPSDPNHGFIDNGIPSWSGGQNPDPAQWENFCRNSMMLIWSQAVMFFANNGRFPDNQEELGLAGLTCPACGQEYILIGSKTEFYVACPMPTDPNHGNIDFGVPSWQE